MPHKITGRRGRNGESVAIDPPDFHPKRGPTSQLRAENVNVTDRHIGLMTGTEIEKGDPGYRVTRYAPDLPVLGGQQPALAHNPYNFVALAGPAPWVEDDDLGATGHSRWLAERLSGHIRFRMTARTPVFVPVGFPLRGDHSRQRRQFFRMRRAEEDRARFAIPGASLKGVLRSAVEAVANDRFGVFNGSFYEKKPPYRRRAFLAGIIEKINPDGSYAVRDVEVYYLNVEDPLWKGKLPDPCKGGFKFDRDPLQRYRKTAVPGTAMTASDVRIFKANLACQPASNHRHTHIIVRPGSKFYTLPKTVAVEYVNNLDNPHYERHVQNHAVDYNPTLHAGDPRLKADLARLVPGEILYFTLTGSTIDSFGKNVNYLWPSQHSVKELSEQFVRPQDGDLSLGHALGMAERMFGFAAPLRRDPKQPGKVISHAFRAKVRVETLWGPLVDNGLTVEVSMAPLTAPEARAKARPLYLEGRNGHSASYSDGTLPNLMGRKFYWHQAAEGPQSTNGLWNVHQCLDEQQSDRAESQLPPPVLAVRAGEQFEGCIQFDNLTPEELGALLFVLEGDGSFDHVLKLGKGKPRGLGSMATEILGVDLLNLDYYDSLESSTCLREVKRKPYLEAFQNWCGTKGAKPFAELGHIQDYMRLHSWPAEPWLRVYPINFSDYGWLPADNTNPDEPRSGKRPPALPRARTVNVPRRPTAQGAVAPGNPI